MHAAAAVALLGFIPSVSGLLGIPALLAGDCLLYTSDAADERSSVDLGGRRIIKKKTQLRQSVSAQLQHTRANYSQDNHTTPLQPEPGDERDDD